VHFSEEKVQVK